MNNTDNTQTPIQRLRQLLYWMKVPIDVVQTLDIAWLQENLSDYSRHPHYAEARAILISLLEVNNKGKSRRIH